MLVPITSVRRPQASERGAKADAETLAWFGTAYGRRDRPVDRGVTPGTSANRPTVIQDSVIQDGVIQDSVIRVGPAATQDTVLRRRYAPLVVLGAVAIALVVLRTMPVTQPLAFAPVLDPLPFETAPQIDASQQLEPEQLTPEQLAPDVPSSRQEAERLARDATVEVKKLAASTLPPLIPLQAAVAPTAVARLASNPASAPNLEPEPVAVTEGGLTNAQTVAQSQPIVSANLATPQRPQAAPSLTDAPNRYGHTDMSAGKAHLANGDLPQARAAFAKAFEKGLPEAALALGNTFDPVSLAKAGVKTKGDPDSARRWYRRAFELAMRGSRRRGQ